MKRKFGDRANWRRITNRQFTCRFVQSKIFTGYITLYTIQDLKEPLWKTYGGSTFCIADKGYSWLQYYPKGEHFVVTAMFDDKERIVEWYIDTCRSQGITDQGVPWFDDLYLDVVVLKDGKYFCWMKMSLKMHCHENILQRVIMTWLTRRQRNCCMPLMHMYSHTFSYH